MKGTAAICEEKGQRQNNSSKINQTNVFINMEIIDMKVVSFTYSIIFDGTCLRESLLPTYINIYTIYIMK